MSGTLQPGAKGADVTAVQAMLNRAGAFLTADGDYGPGTVLAVREFQSLAGLPVTGIVDPDTRAKLQALPEPSTLAATEAIYFIIREEAGENRGVYDRLYSRPDVPGGDSGVTIGVGYDLGQERTFAEDWGKLLTSAELDALLPWVGKQGAAATEGAVQALHAISIAWSAAWRVFLDNSIPAYLNLTRDAFPNFDDLPLLCQGALLGLVYNRGAGMEDAPGTDNRKEMREIQEAMKTQASWPEIPGLFRAMKRLWPHSTDLQGRRDREADMFAEGLRQATAPTA